jgi:hypothetical protein
LAKETFVRLQESGMMNEAWSFQQGFWDQLKSDVQAWEEETKIPVQAMLLLADATFKMRQKQLVEYLSARLQHGLDDVTKRGAKHKALAATSTANTKTLEEIIGHFL